MKSRFLYEYDFGDRWEHELLVEKILPRDEGEHYPLCRTGTRACPPEEDVSQVLIPDQRDRPNA